MPAQSNDGILPHCGRSLTQRDSGADDGKRTFGSCGEDPTRTLASPYLEASHARSHGRRLAERMRPMLARETFKLVLCSPMQWRRETCELAGLGDKAVIHLDLVEWN